MPRRHNAHIVSDPSRGFGRPTVEGTGILAVNLTDMYHAEGAGERGLARCLELWPNLSADQVLAAVEWCERFRALANLGDISMNDDGMLEDRLRAIQGINDRMPEVVKRVYVEDFKDRQHTSDVIRQYISSYRQQGINIDIVFVDYAAKLRCRTKWNDKRHALEEICEDLRGVAKSEDVVMWTAAQSNRQGLLAGLPTMIHVGEAIGQVYAASLLVAIGMEDALPGWDGARPCTIGVDKNTKGQAGFSFGAKALMDRSKFVEDLEEPVRVMGQRRDGESPGGGPGRGRKKDPEVGPDGKRYRRRGGYNGSRAGYEEAPAKDDQ